MRRRHPFYFMKQFFLNLQIRKKLMLSFTVLIMIPVVLMSVFYVTNAKVILQDKSTAYTSDILSVLQQNIDNKLSEFNTIFILLQNDNQLLSLLSSVQTNTPEQNSSVFSQIDSILWNISYNHPVIQSIYVVSYFDHSKFSTIPSATKGISTDELSIMEQMQQTPAWFYNSSGIISYGRLIYSVSTLKPIGYLFINFPETSLFNIYSNVSIFTDNNLFITDTSGTIISDGDKSLLGTKIPADYVGLIDKPNRASFSLLSSDHQNYYVASEAINDGRWRLFYQVSPIIFDQDVQRLTDWYSLISVLVLLFDLVVSAFLAKSISDPIRQLSNTMQLVKDGNFEIQNEYRSKDEVGILSDSFNTMIRNTNTLIQTIYQKELLKQQAELKFLQFQINPHFLYNTLETINWISRIQGVPEAGEIAKALGDLMREGLKGDDFVPIENEIRNVENYLLIQKYRYGDKIKVDVNVDPLIRSVKTPKFILQPIIENAIVHGLDPKIDGGNISIWGGYDGKDIILTVEDNGVGIQPDILRNLLNERMRTSDDGTKHTHIGLLNVHKRLQLYFGPEYGLIIHSEPDVGTVVTIRIPHTE